MFLPTCLVSDCVYGVQMADRALGNDVEVRMEIEESKRLCSMFLKVSRSVCTGRNPGQMFWVRLYSDVGHRADAFSHYTCKEETGSILENRLSQCTVQGRYNLDEYMCILQIAEPL